MSDFFTRLAKRAVGDTTTIKPVVPPRFARSEIADVRPAGVDGELNTVTGNNSKIASKQSKQDNNRISDTVFPGQREPTFFKPSYQSAKEADVKSDKNLPNILVPIARETRVEKETQELTAREIETNHAKKQHREAVINQARQTDESPHHTVQIPDETDDPDILMDINPDTKKSTDHRLLMPQQEKTPKAEYDQHATMAGFPEQREKRTTDKENAAPIVEVKIGRIEIRAENPRPARVKQSQRPDRTSHQMSLDDYLAKRNQELQ